MKAITKPMIGSKIRYITLNTSYNIAKQLYCGVVIALEQKYLTLASQPLVTRPTFLYLYPLTPPSQHSSSSVLIRIKTQDATVHYRDKTVGLAPVDVCSCRRWWMEISESAATEVAHTQASSSTHQGGIIFVSCSCLGLQDGRPTLLDWRPLNIDSASLSDLSNISSPLTSTILTAQLQYGYWWRVGWWRH